MVENNMVCSRCEFVGTEEYFTKVNRTKDGKRALCKKCKSEDDKKYRETHKEYLARYFHNIWINNKNNRREKNREYIDKRRVNMTAKDFTNTVCEFCGMTNEEHKTKYGSRLEVHHGQNTGRHNIRKNKEPIHTDLYVLCKSCHTRMGNLTHRNYSK